MQHTEYRLAAGVLQMKYRTRINYSESQKALMWDRWRKGESLQQIAQLFDRNHSSVQRILALSGGIRPPERRRSTRALSLGEREDISRGIAAGQSMRPIPALCTETIWYLRALMPTGGAVKRKYLSMRGARACLQTLLVLVFSAGCASQPRPLSVRSVQAIVDARREATPWRLDVPVDSRPVAILTVLSDGTRNDRAHVSRQERQTIIAHIADRLTTGGKHKGPVRYYRGAGTEGGPLTRLWDSATGVSTATRAETACQNTLEDIRAIRDQQANADIRVFVAGFSRGAASARHFMNLLERSCRMRVTAADPGIRFYALLFDTVATGQRGNLLLGIPSSADRVLHFVSLDERRIFFRPDLDEPANDGRIRSVPLPGVHSDVGDSYREGVGGEVRDYVDALLYGMGLTTTSVVTVPVDYSLQGGNDSRWLLEKVVGVPVAGTPAYRVRRPFYAPSIAMSGPRDFEWHIRWAALGEPQPLQFYEREDVLRAAFDVRRNGNSFSLVSVDVKWSPEPVAPRAADLFFQPQITRCGDRLALRFDVSRKSPHIFLLPGEVASRIRDQATTRVEIGVVARSTGNQLWWLVDDVALVPMRDAGGSISTPAGAQIACPGDLKAT